MLSRLPQSLLGLLFVSQCLLAAKPSELPHCDINVLLVRAVNRAAAVSILQERLEGFSRTPLVQDLEAIHVHLYQGSRLQRKTFNLLWIFQDADATQLLLSGFYGTTVRTLSEKGEEKILDAVQFVDEYERCFLEAGGTLSRTWNQKRKVEGQHQSDKDRFIKRLFLELAYKHQQGILAEAAQQPVNFSAAADSDVSYLAGYAELYDQFGGSNSFRRAYEDFARTRERVRTPFRAFETSPHYAHVRRELVGAGKLKPGDAGLQPIRRLDQQARDREELLQAVAEAIALNTFPTGYELVGALLSSSDTENDSQFQLMGEFYERVRQLHYANLDAFVAELNQRLDPPLERGTSVQSWAQELVLQAGALHAKATGRPFSGFQAYDTSDDLFINMDNPVVRAAGLTLIRINQAVAERLQP